MNYMKKTYYEEDLLYMKKKTYYEEDQLTLRTEAVRLLHAPLPAPAAVYVLVTESFWTGHFPQTARVSNVYSVYAQNSHC